MGTSPVQSWMSAFQPPGVQQIMREREKEYGNHYSIVGFKMASESANSRTKEAFIYDVCTILAFFYPPPLLCERGALATYLHCHLLFWDPNPLPVQTLYVHAP